MKISCFLADYMHALVTLVMGTLVMGTGTWGMRNNFRFYQKNLEEWIKKLIFAPDIDIVELKNDGMNNIESNKGEIVMYQPDETIRLEVRMEGETVWLSQAQMAELFGTKRPAITKHLNNIYKCGELKEESTCSILEHMGNDGKRNCWII